MEKIFDIIFKFEFLIGFITLLWLGFTVLVEKLRKVPRWARWLANEFNLLYSGAREAARREAARKNASGAAIRLEEGS